MLARLVNGDTLGENDHEQIAASLLEDPPPPPEGGWLESAPRPESSNEEPVRVLSIQNVRNVNRLAENQELTFAPDGLTVVYGNNGSGKSGYARIIQSMVRTRHRTDILPDVFAETSGDRSGEVTFTVGDFERTARLDEPADPALGRVSFYDEHCGDTYLNTEAEISYRPSAVQLLDDLADACMGVRRVIDGWRTQLGQGGSLPDVDESGRAGAFLRGLTAETTDEAITAATACPPDVEEKLSAKVKQVAQLRTSDPAKERRHLTKTAGALDLLVEHLGTLDQALGRQAQERLSTLRERLGATQAAAAVASRGAFDEEPLSGVGSPVWQALWRAAEDYSQSVLPEVEFPYVEDDAVCVLCQQSLDQQTADRLERFRDFVADTTAQDAQQAKEALAGFRTVISRREVVPQPVATAIATIEQAQEGSSGPVQAVLDAFKGRQASLIAGDEPSDVDIATEVNACKAWASEFRQNVESMESVDFATRLAEAESKEQELRDQIAMHAGREDIKKERARLRELATLNDRYSEANTRAITEKASELTRSYVTDEARDRFTREADRLGLERVTFKATRARRGALLHRADFLNAKPDAKLDAVLSEGEQTALGFAGFLTEVYFDGSRSALVFDDPVSSLDHMRRGAVAKRIVSLAGERQVIVFTHDVAFTTSLRKAAREADVAFATRGVERRRKVGPGFTTLGHPWTAQDAAQRVNTLRQEIADLRRTEKGMSQDEYLRSTENIAGHLSQTWERIISQTIAEPLMDYKSMEVRVAKLRLVARVTEADVKAYDDSYSRISGWASRHDPHPELNYTPPGVDELLEEVDVLHDWLNRVKRYKN